MAKSSTSDWQDLTAYPDVRLALQSYASHLSTRIVELEDQMLSFSRPEADNFAVQYARLSAARLELQSQYAALTTAINKTTSGD